MNKQMIDETKEFFESLRLQAVELNSRHAKTSKNQYLKKIGFSPLERRDFFFSKKINQYK